MCCNIAISAVVRPITAAAPGAVLLDIFALDYFLHLLFSGAGGMV